MNYDFQPIDQFLPILSAERQVDILTHNKVIAEMLAKIETQRDKVERQKNFIMEAEAEIVKIDDTIADLKSQLKSAESHRGEALGRKNSAAHHVRLAERAITETKSRIGTFGKSVIQRECERELRSIGRTLRMPGRRGGDIQILDVGKAYPRVGDPDSGAKLGDYREQNGFKYEISREAKPKPEQPLFPSE